MALTPMMQQYFKLKEEYPDCILFFRLGDFYEMFFEDAQVASKELELVLTGRDCGLEERAPMCGIPYHAAKNYIGRMVDKGYRIAICEQMEDPALAKGIVRRDVIKIITPGTINDETFLTEDANSYLMAIKKGAGNGSYPEISLAVTDITTGDFLTASFPYDLEILRSEIAKYDPREILLFEEDEVAELVRREVRTAVTLQGHLLPLEEDAVLHHEFTHIQGSVPYNGKQCVLGLVNYLKSTQKMSLSHLTTLEAYAVSDTMALDLNTRRNLELTENIVDKSKRGSLIWILDQTMTAMGARNLRRWIEKPLIVQQEIQNRLDAVEALYRDIGFNEEIRETLKGVYDIERMSGKVAQKNINPRELLSLKQSLERIPTVKQLLGQVQYGVLEELREELDELADIADLIGRAISEDAGVSSKEGEIIKAGYDKGVDELRDIKRHGRQWIAQLEAQERSVTGISSLKVGFNKVFGYYIEITKANFGKIPEGRYVRKQTLANAERYITEELKEMEEKILGAEEKLQDLEYSLFVQVRDQVEANTERLKRTAAVLAQLDCYAAFAKVALDRSYVRPSFNNQGVIKIADGRHPVVEAMIPRGEFIANDTLLDFKKNNFLIITGPNMAGKSTYMRQVALITLMAQIGSFVPAVSADLSVTDRIFTRIGASDDLSGGKSTFMVEMTEVSNILKNASHDSLILLDEVGRGTSTYDGMAIAWSVTEHLMKEDGIKARTLFATHYHELIALEKQLPGVRNYSVAVKEVGQSIIFLRKIIPGGADESYGVEVARLAGLPQEVIQRAREILLGLEDSGKKKKIKERTERIQQLNFMDVLLDEGGGCAQEVLDALRGLNLNAMSPMEAMMKLYELQNQLKGD
ncbi:DNA mismatch repair protein MutS [Proteiniclasticum sp. QWL-01]|uniref:DNA mismatch repair protein MutS n=1 Tax=Proteiniclasticum sp. QWL-01 TaxID=3036945 RepID=UPI0021FEB06C|nr:DNA mismatch repair protein MutS [Proteiniclasticum sp. QWL-01]UUM13022.1 DNA mismatch repair protein MutS [Clostridiaceae bacterium HFYG-1003]WFF71447.1 DNA mismatch repair protein MutS [Proteiniclasticum sp. QWL-01]